MLMFHSKMPLTLILLVSYYITDTIKNISQSAYDIKVTLAYVITVVENSLL